MSWVCERVCTAYVETVVDRLARAVGNSYDMGRSSADTATICNERLTFLTLLSQARHMVGVVCECVWPVLSECRSGLECRGTGNLSQLDSRSAGGGRRLLLQGVVSVVRTVFGLFVVVQRVPTPVGLVERLLLVDRTVQCALSGVGGAKRGREYYCAAVGVLVRQEGWLAHAGRAVVSMVVKVCARGICVLSFPLQLRVYLSSVPYHAVCEW